MAEKRNKANKADLHYNKEESTAPEEFLRGSDGLVDRLRAVELELSALERRQELMEQRQTEAEAVRRGQLDCLSERVFEAEKAQRSAQERTDDAIEKARAAFQKTASDMEYERSNLMCVINQVNQNFEHLSREMDQLSGHVTRTQQDQLQLQQEVAERYVDDATGLAQQFAEMEEHLGSQWRETRESQRSVSQQLCDLQCQFVALAEKERASSNFKKEVGVYLDQVIHSTRDSEARCRGLDEQLARLEQEVSMTIAEEVSRQVKALAFDARSPEGSSERAFLEADPAWPEGDRPKVSQERSRSRPAEEDHLLELLLQDRARWPDGRLGARAA